MRSIVVSLLALGAVTAAVYFGLLDGAGGTVSGNSTSAGPPAAAPVVAARVVREAFQDTLEALGTVQANESVIITPNRADHVTAVHFEDGQHVERGELLVEMHAEEEQALLAEAIALRNDLKINDQQNLGLRDQGLMSGREYEATRAHLDASEAKVQSLQAAIADRQVRAPFAGVLGLRRISPGAYVQPSTVITTLDDLSVVKLDFTIPETWLAHVEAGMRITARSDVWTEDEFSGEVRTVDTRLDPRTRSAVVRARLANPDLKLRPGMLLKVTIERGSDSILQVPEEALVPLGDEQFVFRIDDEDVARRVQVRVGRRQLGRVEILHGLGEGDRVVIEGIVRVRPDLPVRVVRMADPEA